MAEEQLGPDVLWRPQLAPGIDLLGPVQGSALAGPQFLIRRDAQYLQVSQLLYRVAEAVDGQRTLNQIAASVTDESEWRVTPDHVRRLLESKLVPLGIVAADHCPSTTPRLPYRPMSVSPLTIGLRKQLFGRRVLDQVTTPLQLLYVPPVLLACFLAITVAHGWLYLHHGLAAPISDVLSHP